jgi:hypothetical protein
VLLSFLGHSGAIRAEGKTCIEGPGCGVSPSGKPASAKPVKRAVVVPFIPPPTPGTEAVSAALTKLGADVNAILRKQQEDREEEAARALEREERQERQRERRREAKEAEDRQKAQEERDKEQERLALERKRKEFRADLEREYGFRTWDLDPEAVKAAHELCDGPDSLTRTLALMMNPWACEMLATRGRQPGGSGSASTTTPETVAFLELKHIAESLMKGESEASPEATAALCKDHPELLKAKDRGLWEQTCCPASFSTGGGHQKSTLASLTGSSVTVSIEYTTVPATRADECKMWKLKGPIVVTANNGSSKHVQLHFGWTANYTPEGPSSSTELIAGHTIAPCSIAPHGTKQCDVIKTERFSLMAGNEISAHAIGAEAGLDLMEQCTKAGNPDECAPGLKCTALRGKGAVCTRK